MRAFITLFLLITSIPSFSNPFLVEVNKEWLSQTDVNLVAIDIQPASNQDAIQLHLKLVEGILRNRETNHLSSEQRNNRLKCLDILKEYWQVGLFPNNEHYDVRTPIFIDDYNTFCAVGHLMKETGFESVAREISHENNLVYVRDIRNKKAAAWMKWAGLTMEECAWIQPGYPPATDFKSCGKGVNGTVHKLQTIGQELFVLGDFDEVDSSIASNGVAKYVRSGTIYQWQDYSNGLPLEIFNGSLLPKSIFTSIIEYNGTLWLGGDKRSSLITTANDFNMYTNVNNVWQVDSTIVGRVLDMVIYNNDLYACGNFYTPAGNYVLAKYNSIQKSWEMLLPVTGSHSIHVMKEYNGNLILGGSYIGFQNCDNVFSFDGNTLSPMYIGLKNPVYALEVHQGKLYAAGNMKGNDIYNMKYWNGSVWLDTNTFNLNVDYTDHINCLRSIDNVLYYGGHFAYTPMIGPYANNFMTNQHNYNWGIFDSTVNDIEVYDGKIFTAGAFTKRSMWSAGSLNHIVYLNSAPNAVKLSEREDNLQIYPNPTRNRILIESEMSLTSYALYNMTGKIVAQGPLPVNHIDLSQYGNGVYVLKFTDINGLNYIKSVLKE